MHRATIANSEPEPADRLTKMVKLTLAIAAGLSVANIYYAQPLLDALARDFGMSPASVGIVVTLTQIGYGLGLIFVVPLGDLVAPRRLILIQGALSIIALVGVATARTEAILLASLATMGLLAVVVQVLVALAATLATPAQRGNAVGTVTSGIVIGILGARFVAGLLADVGGWRTVYLTSALFTAAVLALLMRVLPRQDAPVSATVYSGSVSERSCPFRSRHPRVLDLCGIQHILDGTCLATERVAILLLAYSNRRIRPCRPGGCKCCDGCRQTC